MSVTHDKLGDIADKSEVLLRALVMHRGRGLRLHQRCAGTELSLLPLALRGWHGCLARTRSNSVLLHWTGPSHPGGPVEVKPTRSKSVAWEWSVCVNLLY